MKVDYHAVFGVAWLIERSAFDGHTQFIGMAMYVAAFAIVAVEGVCCLEMEYFCKIKRYCTTTFLSAEPPFCDITFKK